MKTVVVIAPGDADMHLNVMEKGRTSSSIYIERLENVALCKYANACSNITK